VLLAIPIGKIKPRKGRHSKLLPAVLLFIFYLGLLITGRGWVESGSLGEFPGMYMIHLIFIILGLVLLFKKELIKKF
jgi:lipopolysaccharide export system permease protein